MDQFSQSPSPMQPPKPEYPPDQAEAVAKFNLARRAKSGANTFYWISGFSIFNSVVMAFGGTTYFVVGLAAALFTGAVAIGVGQASPNIAFIAKMVGLALGIMIAGIVALIGFFAGKGQRWAFITGMILYSLDTALMLFFQDWVGILFHLYFLWLLFSGWQAFNKLIKLSAPPPVSNIPQNLGV